MGSPLEVGRYEFGVSENDVISDSFVATLMTEIVMLNEGMF